MPKTPSHRVRPVVDRPVFLGPPPLIEGEDAAAYDELQARTFAAVKPSDFIEEFFTHEFVDLTWEVRRWRSLKATLLSCTMHRGVKDLLVPIMSAGDDCLSTDRIEEVQGLSYRWAARDSAARAQVETLLKSAGLTMDAVRAQTLVANLDPVERIDRMLVSAAARRDRALREIERHRAAFADKLRRETQVVEEAEYEIVEPQNGRRSREP